MATCCGVLRQLGNGAAAAAATVATAAAGGVGAVCRPRQQQCLCRRSHPSEKKLLRRQRGTYSCTCKIVYNGPEQAVERAATLARQRRLRRCTAPKPSPARLSGRPPQTAVRMPPQAWPPPAAAALLNTSSAARSRFHLRRAGMPLPAECGRASGTCGASCLRAS